MSTPHGKLRLGALVALVVGSMIGGGIFSLPQNMAASAEAGAVLIGWAITAIGMLTLAFVFKRWRIASPIWTVVSTFTPRLVSATTWGSRPRGDTGSARGSAMWVTSYCCSARWITFSLFWEGNTVAAIIGASVLLWGVHFLVLRGIQEAAFINLVTTVAKVVPLILFVLIAVFAFKLDIFTADIWGLKNLTWAA